MRELLPAIGVNVNREIDKQIEDSTKDSCVVLCDKLKIIPVPVPVGAGGGLQV